MSIFREFIAQVATAIAAQRKLSRLICNGCELRNHCQMPPERRQLCWEIRAVRPRWWQ